MPENNKPEVFIIAAITADGFIAKDENHAASWTSKDDKAHFVALTKEAGAVIMGSKTFDTLPRPLKERLNVVYTRNPEKYPIAERPENLIFTDADPAIVIHEIAAKGHAKVAICGGASIYSLFMKSGMVSKLHLTIEPLIFGTGVSLFDQRIEAGFELIESKIAESGSVFLTYELRK